MLKIFMSNTRVIGTEDRSRTIDRGVMRRVLIVRFLRLVMFSSSAAMLLFVSSGPLASASLQTQHDTKMQLRINPLIKIYQG